MAVMSILKSYLFVYTTSIILLCLSSLTVANAAPDTGVYSQQVQLLEQQLAALAGYNQATQGRLTALHENQEALKQRIAEGLEQVSEQQLELAALNVSLAQSSIQQMSQALRDARRNTIRIQARIDQMEEHSLQLRLTHGVTRLPEDLQQLDRNIEQQYLLHDLQLKQIDALQKSYANAEQVLALQENWQQYLQKTYQQQQRSDQYLALEQLTQEIREKQDAWLDELMVYNQRRQALTSESVVSNGELVGLEIKIFLLEQQINLSQVSLRIAYFHHAATGMLVSLTESYISYELRNYSESVSNLLADGSAMNNTLQESIELIQQYRTIQAMSYEKNIIDAEQYQQDEQSLTELIGEYQQQAQIISGLTEELSDYQGAINIKIAEAAVKRQGLPGFDKQEWITLAAQILYIPDVSWNYLQAFHRYTADQIQNLKVYQLVLLLTSLFILLLVWFLARHYIRMMIRAMEEKPQRVSSNFALIVARLLRRNLTGLVLFAAFLSVMVLSHITFNFYSAIFYLVLVWFVFRFIIGITRLSLVERVSDTTGDDVRLYYRLKWTFLLGGVVTALSVLVYQLNLAQEVRDFFIRLFLLFVLMVSLVLLKGYRVVPGLLEPFIDKRRLYLKRAINLLCIFVPLTLLSNALIGLIGYINLAHTISYYQLILLTVVTLYVIIRGFIIDLMDLAAGLVIRHSKNGWLWSEALLKPLDKIFRFIFFIATCFTLLYIYGWERESVIATKAVAIMRYDLIPFSGVHITLTSIIEFIILVTVFVWASRWIKEFAYRWLFKNVRDPSVRYSFSSFSQYTMVTLGIVVTFRVLGIEFGSMAVVLGGLAIGVGFGLRDFANNIISGIMLLIERPVREGDLITIDDFEGRVTYIGLRSMRARSWDNMEMLIPNSELFNKIFLNWTRQDNVVRTTLPIKIQRDDNVFRTQQLILDVLDEIPEVLHDPEPEAFLLNLDGALVEFEVRYFINVDAISRPRARSIVLFSIWKRFEEYGIKPPYPQQNLHIKNLPDVQ